MRIGRFVFKPSLVPTLAVLLLLPAMLALGCWQLGRAEEKRVWLAGIEAARELPAISLNEEQPAFDEANHRLAKARGRYDDTHQFLLNNQLQQGQLGYRVITPLLLEGSGQAVLVDRGWVAAPALGLPDIALPAGEVEFSGRIDRGPSVAMRLGAAGMADGGWPHVLHYLDYAYIQAQLPYPTLPYLLRADEGPVAVETNMPPEKHVGYAVQWFAMATTLALIYLVVNLRRQEEEQDA